MPAAHWQSGSTITAAISRPCRWKNSWAAASDAPRSAGLYGTEKAVDREQQRTVRPVKAVQKAGRHRAERVAVVGVFERHDASAPGFSSKGKSTARPISCRLDRTGAIAREMNVPRRIGHQIRERRRQVQRGTVREIAEDALLQNRRLPADRLDQSRMPMAEVATPPRRHGVDVAPAALVRTARAFSPHDHRHAVAERGKARVRMPDAVGAVALVHAGNLHNCMQSGQSYSSA